MKIAISGSTGFIGSNLSAFLADKGIEVCGLKRSHFLPEQREELIKILGGCQVVINLAGTSINCRWTKRSMKDIYDSRIFTTRDLVSAINTLEKKPSLLISTSAVGIYTGQEVQDESSGKYSDSYLAKVCKDWEMEAGKVSSEVRLVIARFGVVLSSNGGAFPLMALPFRFFIGGRIGSGKQGFSWIHLQDLLEAFWITINNAMASGIIHFTSPQLSDNRLFTDTLARVLHRPALFSIPTFVFKLLYRAGHIVVTTGQKVYPHRLLEMGFTFRHPDLESALKEITSKFSTHTNMSL